MTAKNEGKEDSKLDDRKPKSVVECNAEVWEEKH